MHATFAKRTRQKHNETQRAFAKPPTRGIKHTVGGVLYARACMHHKCIRPAAVCAAHIEKCIDLSNAATACALVQSELIWRRKQWSVDSTNNEKTNDATPSGSIM